MSDNLMLIPMVLIGLLLGAFFFGGLWWTVQKGVSSKYAALWFLGSLVLRVGLVSAGFYWASGQRWERLLACLLGFVFARLIALRLTRLSGNNLAYPKREATHASKPR